MRIAVLNEVSACEKNADIVNALSGRNHEILNLGMRCAEDHPTLTYLHTGFLTGYLLNEGKADFVVGGCGTGLGFMMSAMMYPGVFCGLIQEPLDAWLFAQINAGNSVSLSLNKGYGWGGVENLKMIFDALFSVTWGIGYPSHRRESQADSRARLAQISAAVHRPMNEIMMRIDQAVVKESLEFLMLRDEGI